MDFSSKELNDKKELIINLVDSLPDKALELSLELHKSILASKNDLDLGYSHIVLGATYHKNGQNDKSEDNFRKAIDLFNKIDNDIYATEAYLRLAKLFINEARFNEANETALKALELSERAGLIDEQARSNNIIGLSYDYQDNFLEALKYYKITLEIYRESSNVKGMGNAFNNIGVMHDLMNEMDSAYYYYTKSLKVDEQLGDKKGIAGSLINLAVVAQVQKKYERADSLLNESINIYLEIGSPEEIAIAYNNLSDLYYRIDDYDKALIAIRKSQEVCFQNGLFRQELDNYQMISLIYKELNQFDSAYFYHRKFSESKDSANVAKTSRELAEMHEKYENDKKELQIENLNKEKREVELVSENQQKSITNLWLIAGLLFLFGGGAFLLFIIKKRNNNDLERLNDQLTIKNTEIVDSINYAKRIQQALLKSEEHVSVNYPNHFIYLEPKDIVSGDFYWSYQKEDYLYIAVADCTGHGVPGAFMSILGISFLNEIVSGEKLLSPAEILDDLSKRIIKELSQKGKENDTKDGMDMSLLRINQRTNQVDWAGANNGVYIVKDDNISEVKADRQPIGYFDKAKPFTNKELPIETSNTTLYLFTDGYADQFGGARGKKFKYKPFQKLLTSISKEDMDNQKNKLKYEFESWKGDLEQLDDVCIIGIRV